MYKRLTAKVQKLNPAMKDFAGTFSFCVSIEPDNKDQYLSKGCVYAVFNIESDSSLDVKVVIKVVSDVLNDCYYTSDSVSPVQSLERALSEIKDHLTRISSNAILVDSKLTLNVVASVLWGNVLYVVQYGNGHCFLMREGEIRPIQTMGEGNFLAASGVTKDDDVAILCTDSFEKKFPPKKLLTLALSEDDLCISDACLLMKFMADTSYTEMELPSLKPVPVTGKQKFEIAVETFAKKVQSKIKIKMPVLKHQSKGFAKGAFTSTSNKTKIKPVWLIGGLVTILLVGGGLFFWLKKPKLPFDLNVPTNIQLPAFVPKSLDINGILNKLKGTQPVQQPASQQTTQDQQATTPTTTEDDYTKDGESKITRVKVDSVLYDLKISDPYANPSAMVFYKNKIVLADGSSGKIYTSLATDIRFLPIEQTYAGIKKMATDDTGKLTFSDNSGYKVFDLNKLDLVEKYDVPAVRPFDVFLDFIYALDAGKIVKNTKTKGMVADGAVGNGTLSVSTWAENADFTNAKDISIAYSVYVVTKDNNIVKYTTGKKDAFVVLDVPTPFKNITQLAVSADFKNMYVLDRDNYRIVVLDKNGKFIKQYKYEKSAEWNDLKSIAVSPDEKSLYVLNGSKIYEIKL